MVKDIEGVFSFHISKRDIKEDTNKYSQNKNNSVAANNNNNFNKPVFVGSSPSVDQSELLEIPLYEDLSKLNLFVVNKRESQKVSPYELYQLEFDGCSRGNPGLSSAAFILREALTSKVVLESNYSIGIRTINQAEYVGLIIGLHVSVSLGIKYLRIRGNSEVVMK